MQNAWQVAQALDETATLLRLSGEAKFKVKAYEHAARVVEMLGDELGAVVERGELRGLPGIGAALSQQIPAARERGIPFVISVDAHSTSSLGLLSHGITQARRGGVLVREVLNARSPAEFASSVKPL